MSNEGKFLFLSGPCALESEECVMRLAHTLMKIIEKHQEIDFYFKASWDKANRTKATNYRGLGLDEGMRILQKVKDNLGLKIVTDIHEPWQAEPVAEVADILQIPAFLCRQTDLLKAAAETGRTVNVKKAQFMSPEEMTNVVGKLDYFGCHNVLLCERGTCFGYNNLVVDMSGVVRLSKIGKPVIFDATHSVQISGGGFQYGNSGRREYVPFLARAAMATGVLSGMFMEVHDDPDNALCDGSCMLTPKETDQLLDYLMELRELNNKFKKEFIV